MTAKKGDYTITVYDNENGEQVSRFDLSIAELFYYTGAINELNEDSKRTAAFLNKLIDWERRLINEDKSLIKMTELYQIGIIREALIKTKGNISEASRLLDMNRTTLTEMMKRFGIKENPESLPHKAAQAEKLIESIEYNLIEKEKTKLTEYELEKNIERAKNLLDQLVSESNRRTINLNIGFPQAINAN